MKATANPLRIALLSLVFGGLLSEFGAGQAAAKEPPKVYPVAIFAFQERGSGVEGYGEKVSDVMFASFATNEKIFLVDRADIDKLLDEQELNLSGIVAADQATRVGHLTGAKILVTGSVIEVGNSLYIVAKIIGTETSRVLGQSVKGKTSDDLAPLVEQLAEKVATTITTEADKLVAKEEKREDRIKVLKEQIGKAKRPAVFISVTEQHATRTVPDPAAQTELMLCCVQSGFEVIDPEKGTADQADVIITGEGISEFAARRGNLVSVKARLELKATDRATGKVLAVDRQVTVAVDLTEQIAGKSALQEGALDIAMRLLPKVVER
ncbi:MAG: CsgG/HfaB family protein [Planctomycetota bacterium]|jgi:TolB-like protein